MLGIFRSKPILSSEDTEFQIATFKWLLKNFGGKDFYEHTKLILPTREYFPSKVESPAEAAIETFNAVKEYAGMEEWPCRLEAQEPNLRKLLKKAAKQLSNSDLINELAEVEYVPPAHNIQKQADL